MLVENFVNSELRKTSKFSAIGNTFSYIYNLRCFVVCQCSNNIDEIAQITFLALCASLTCLTLDGNPICVAPEPSAADVSTVTRIFLICSHSC